MIPRNARDGLADTRPSERIGASASLRNTPSERGRAAHRRAAARSSPAGRGLGTFPTARPSKSADPTAASAASARSLGLRTGSRIPFAYRD